HAHTMPDELRRESHPAIRWSHTAQISVLPSPIYLCACGLAQIIICQQLLPPLRRIVLHRSTTDECHPDDGSNRKVTETLSVNFHIPGVSFFGIGGKSGRDSRVASLQFQLCLPATDPLTHVGRVLVPPHGAIDALVEPI